MNLPLYIAKRYLVSKSKQNAINIINIFAFVVVVAATAAMFIVLSGFSGLKDFGLSFSNSFDSDLKITPAQGKSFIISAEQLDQLQTITEVVAFSKVVEERVFLNFKQKSAIPILKGVDNNFQKVVAIDSVTGYGNWVAPNSSEIVVGANIASQLGAGILSYGSLIEVIVPKAGKGSLVSNKKPYNSQLVSPVDYYQISEDLDGKYVFCDIALAQELLGFQPNTYTGIELKISPIAKEAKLREQLSAIFNNNIVIRNREQQNEALYKMLNTENIAIYLILTLVLIIALFNVIGSIIMMILDKRKDLTVMLNLGFTIKQVRKVFFNLGMLLTIVGGGIGLALGAMIVALQKTFSLAMITETLPYPVALRWNNALLIIVTIVVLGFVASKIASSRINKKLVA